MRLSGPIFEATSSPDDWIRAVKAADYEAASVPLPVDSDDATVRAYLDAAARADIKIGEVGAWSNPISPNADIAREAVEKCISHLAWAERIGAVCCVNVAGSRHATLKSGPHPNNFSREIYDLIVETTRKIIDAVKPTRTVFSLEPMPWIYPSSPDQYLDLIRDIDRPAFAVHLDPVNMINSIERAFNTGDFIRECFAKLGPRIKSCHAKDVILRDHLTLHLDQCRPGTGLIDYDVFLRELAQLDANTPIVLEYLTEEEYPVAARYIREVQKRNGVR